MVERAYYNIEQTRSHAFQYERFYFISDMNRAVTCETLQLARRRIESTVASELCKQQNNHVYLMVAQGEQDNRKEMKNCC